MQEVGGSIPPGSTSLRLLRKLRLGEPCAGLSQRSKRRLPRRSPKGEMAHTSKYRPWQLKTCVALSDEKQPFAFELEVWLRPGICEEAPLML
jgi:putative endonuclease